MQTEDCIACWCDIDQENICFYISEVDHTSQKSRYCWTCANCEVAEFYSRWKNSVDNADCASALRRMIAKGPPMTFTDVDVSLKWQNTAKLMKGNGTSSRSAHLDGAPATIQDRDKLWASLREREKDLPENNDMHE